MVKAVIADAWMVEEVVARRKKLGLDRRDELWDGVWHMPPMANLEHQRMEAELLIILKEVVERVGLGRVFHEVNVADAERGMDDFRIPDLVVLLTGSRARMEEVYIAGGPDFLIEIHSPGDETDEKLPWYAAQGVREVLVIGRDTKALTLYRRRGQALRQVAASPAPMESDVVPLSFQRLEEGGRPRVRVTHREEPGRVWVV